MALTVHEAKRVHANLVIAFDNAISYFEHQPDLADGLSTARTAASRLAATTIGGRSSDPIEAPAADALREVVAAGRGLLGLRDVAKKVSRFQRWIDEADRALGQA